MHFLFPHFLWALTAISIPIIIHLFHFRRYKKIIFSDIRFLQQIQQESKAKRKLKEWLILACRILAVSLIVLAFAQPFIPAAPDSDIKQQQTVSIYIDNSFSMNNDGKNGQLLEEAKNKAHAILSAYSNTDRFHILTNDFTGKQMRLINKSEAAQAIDEIRITSLSRSIPEVFTRQKSTIGQTNQGKLLFYISDFQKSATKTSELKADSSFAINFIPLAANAYNNLSVDSVWLTSPVVRLKENATLKVRIKNHGKETIENLAISLKINDVQKGLVTVSCGPGESATAEMNVVVSDAGWLKGEVSITDHPVTFDDKYFFALKPVESNQVLCINGYAPSSYLNHLFATDVAFRLTNTSQDQINYAAFKSFDLIILNETKSHSSGFNDELKKYIENGGQVVIIPSEKETDLGGLNTLLNTCGTLSYSRQIKQELKVSDLNHRDDLFKAVFSSIPRNMDLPVIHQSYSFNTSGQARGKKIITLNDGNSFLWQSTYKKGQIYLLSVPLKETWSNFPMHSLFVPVFFKLGLGSGKQLPLSYHIGSNKWVKLPEVEDIEGEKLLRFSGNKSELITDMVNKNGSTEAFVGDELKDAGVYQLTSQNNKQQVAMVAFNFNRNESALQSYPAEELALLAGTFGNARVRTRDTDVLAFELKNEVSGTPLWRICIILALLFVAFEILLLKLK